MISMNRVRTVLFAVLALTALPFATGCAGETEEDADDVKVEVTEPTTSPDGITVNLDPAAACAKKGMTYDVVSGSCYSTSLVGASQGVTP